MFSGSPLKRIRPLKTIWPMNLYLPPIVGLEPTIETLQSPALAASTCSTNTTTSRCNPVSPYGGSPPSPPFLGEHTIEDRKKLCRFSQGQAYACAAAQQQCIPWPGMSQSKSRLSTGKIMSTGPAPQLPSDEADLEQLQRQSQRLVAEIRSAGAVGGSQQIAAFIKRLVEWEDWFLSLQSRAGELEAAALSRYSRRLLEIQKDSYGAKKIYLEMYADAVKSEQAIRQTWNDANRESIRIVSEQLQRNRQVFDEVNRKWGALLRGECPYCGYPLGRSFACHCPCRPCHSL
jgi:hypothetical protein